MDKSVMELLHEVSGAELLIAILLIIALCVLVLTQKEKLSKQLNKWRKKKNDEEDFHALVYELKNSIEKLSKEVKQNQDNRDREFSELHKELTTQSQNITELKDTVIKIQEKNSETKRAEIKEKIERIYRECTHEQVCTEMQFESLKDLIEQYEKHGGDNSFVHTTVQPEMYKWQVVKEVRKVSRKND